MFGITGARLRIWGSGIRVWGLGTKVLGFRDQGVNPFAKSEAFGITGAGLRAWGSGMRVDTHMRSRSRTSGSPCTWSGPPVQGYFAHKKHTHP